MNEGQGKGIVTKLEDNPSGMLIHWRCEMGGKVVLSVLQKDKGHVSHVSAKIEECRIQLDYPSVVDWDLVGTRHN